MRRQLESGSTCPWCITCTSTRRRTSVGWIFDRKHRLTAHVEHWNCRTDPWGVIKPPFKNAFRLAERLRAQAAQLPLGVERDQMLKGRRADTGAPSRRFAAARQPSRGPVCWEQAPGCSAFIRRAEIFLQGHNVAHPGDASEDLQTRKQRWKRPSATRARKFRLARNGTWR
jgi:hypothetical protein